MGQDAFSRYHPGVNFLYFVGAIAFGAVIQHPAYLAAGLLGAGSCCLLLTGCRGWKTLLGLLPLMVLISIVNPLFNTYGKTVLFSLLGRNYTLEALGNGCACAATFGIMVLWFGCYNAVLTGDKFTGLFGNLIPSLSLILVMVLRMIPGLTRRAKQISGARACIGKGIESCGSVKSRLSGSAAVLSALTDWALEGSVTTADSMRARGYGSTRRTGFRSYRMEARDWALLVLILVLAGAVMAAGGTGASYTPRLRFDPVGIGFGAYVLYLMIPLILHGWEVLTWRSLRSKI